MEPSSLGLLCDYTPLVGNQIRLIKLSPASSHTNELSCRLENIDLNTNPTYFALSYVWGDAKHCKSISVNGKHHLVTSSLFDALFQIIQHVEILQTIIQSELKEPCTELMLWVDAICINQQDITEKSVQVPQIGKIYSRAFNVLVWLGKPEPLGIDPETSPIFYEEAYQLRPTNIAFAPRRNENSSAQSNPIQSREAIQTAQRITEAAWFRRVWTFQEYALSQRRPWALLGSEVFTLEVLLTMLNQKLSDNETSDWPAYERYHARGIKKLTHARTQILNVTQALASSDFKHLSLPHMLEFLLCHKLLLSSSLPHDQIYGILGLIDIARLPDALKPDYTKPFDKVAHEYAQYIFSATSSLSLLNIGRPPSVEQTQPSWVPNFYSWMVPSDTRFSQHKGSIQVSGNGSELTVDAVLLPSILRVFCPYKSTGLTSLPENINQFYETVLQKSADLRQLSPDMVWKEFMARVEADSATPMPYISVYELVRLPNTSDTTKWHFNFFKNFYTNRNYILLSDGTILCTLTNAVVPNEETDILAVFKGSASCTVLTEVNDGNFKCVGSAQMLKDTCAPRRFHDLDESFFTSRKVERVTLV